MTIDVTDATFQVEVLDRSNSVPVIVDLWAPWCEPCKTLGPILEKHCDATNGQVVLAKVNVDENPSISMAFQVQSIPAVFIMKDGAVMDGFVGMKPEHAIKDLVEALDRNAPHLLALGKVQVVEKVVLVEVVGNFLNHTVVHQEAVNPAPIVDAVVLDH
jgi:thioredoxin